MKKILVIGDSCQDMFKYGVCDRLSPEAPIPIMKPTRTIGNGGMSINVFENLKVFDVDCDLITNDIRPVKMRYIDEVSNQLLLRIDENDSVKPITANTIQNINYNNYDAIVISDYNKGYLSENDIKYISNNHHLVFLDTKKKIGEWAKHVEFIKINEKEYLENNEFLSKYVINSKGNLIVTKGKDGATWNMIEGFPINEENIRDLSGAGDTFLAGLVADYIKNSDIRSAIRFANKCAAWVVTQKGVAIVDFSKILEL